MKNRNWCFTAFIEPKIDTKNVEYYVYKPEKCPKTEKIHYQGYIEFDIQKRMGEVKKVFNDNTLHLEIRHGTQKQAIDYCKKEETKAGDIVEWGRPKRQGNRSDLDAIWEAIDDGHTSLEILREFKGHALKHINMVEKGLMSRWECCAIDKIILYDRKHNKENPQYEHKADTTVSEANVDDAETSEIKISNLSASSSLSNASEVGGNTKPPTLNSIVSELNTFKDMSIPTESTVKDRVKKLRKVKRN